MEIKNYNLNEGGSSEHLRLTLIVNGREFEWTKQYITGKEARHIAELADETDLYLGISDPWDDEPVGLDTKIDLGREGIESFYVRNLLQLEIEGKQYQWKNQYITGKELRKLAGINEDEEILLMLQKPFEDEWIRDETRVDLARPGIEHFKVKKKDQDVIVTIRINDKPYTVKRGLHTVAELKKIGGVALADELSEAIQRKLIPLKDDAIIVIKGCEEFFSCKREGTSS